MVDGRNVLSRRRFVRVSSGAVAGVAGLGLVGRSSRVGLVAAQDDVTIRWWDQFLPLEPLHQAIWDAYQAAHPNVSIDYTQYNPQEMGQALQLAFKSGQMPDIHTLAGVGIPSARLVREGWFQPLPQGEELRQLLPPGSFLEGFSVFGGQVYSLPLFSFRQYTSLNWFNRDLMEGAGIDPETGPTTWDQFRQAATAITEKGGGQAFGWIQGLGFVDRLAVHVNELAQAAGAAVSTGGVAGVATFDPKTGEYPFGRDPYVQALEFLASLDRDGALFPGSLSLDARTARARWATGAAGMFLDGPWNIGVVQAEFADFMDRTGVAPVPAPDGGTPPLIHNAPLVGEFWVSSQSKNPAVAGEILRELTTREYYVGLAERMDQPPLDLSVVEEANVHPTYRRAIQLFQEGVRLAPSPLIKNPGMAEVIGEMQPIHPNLGEIAQGVFSGDIDDPRTALQSFADQLSAERERAIGVVRGRGVEVSLDDWVFPTWQPGEDFAADSAATPISG